MRRVISTTTSDGSVTIPPHVRRRLGLRKNDKVSFIIEDGKVELRATRKITILDLRGTLPPPDRETEEFDDLIAEAMDDWIEREIKEGRL
jgi:AbrB family looped-hinge helix DNA binding protein